MQNSCVSDSFSSFCEQICAYWVVNIWQVVGKKKKKTLSDQPHRYLKTGGSSRVTPHVVVPSCFVFPVYYYETVNPCFVFIFCTYSRSSALPHEYQNKERLPHGEVDGCMNGHFPFPPLARTLFIQSHSAECHSCIGSFLIFMPADRFTPVSQTETSVIYLSALFNGAFRMRISWARVQRVEIPVAGDLSNFLV